MNVLLAGNEPQKRVELLLSLTRIDSNSVIKALTLHLVNGFGDNMAAQISGVDKSNFNRALKKLNHTASIVEQIKDIDFANNRISKVVG